MSLVEVDRFYDQPSGHVALSALRAAGIPAVLFGSYLAGALPVSVGWEGGMRLCVPKEDVEAAHEILNEAVPLDPEALEWGQHPEAKNGAPLALATFLAAILGGWAAGLAMAAHKVRPTWVTRVGLVFAWLILGTLVFCLLKLLWGGSRGGETG